MLFKYRSKYMSWKKIFNPSTEFKSDMDMAGFAVLVENIPKRYKNLTMVEFEKLVNNIFKKMWPPLDGHSPFIKFNFIGDYTVIYD